MPDNVRRTFPLSHYWSFVASGLSRGKSVGNDLKSASADSCDKNSRRLLLACYRRKEREQLAGLLRQKHSVTACEDGHDALRRIAATDFDLVVTAITMPRVDGLELLRVLHCRRPGLPVIAVAEGSGIMDEIYLRSATSLGAAGTCTSPVNVGAFLANVDRVLNNPTNIREKAVR
jgi:DNA-binding NtrC family response regulator